MPSLDNRIPPPVVGALVAAGMWGVAALGPELPIDSVAKYLATGVLAATGIALDVLGLLAFRKARTTVNPLKPARASSVVTSGVYRITRNPMYLGLALLLLAWAVWLSALPPFGGPVLFVLYITRFQIVPEERALRGRFGDEYEAYAARVRRWL